MGTYVPLLVRVRTPPQPRHIGGTQVDSIAGALIAIPKRLTVMCNATHHGKKTASKKSPTGHSCLGLTRKKAFKR